MTLLLRSYPFVLCRLLHSYIKRQTILNFSCSRRLNMLHGAKSYVNRKCLRNHRRKLRKHEHRILSCKRQEKALNSDDSIEIQFRECIYQLSKSKAALKRSSAGPAKVRQNCHCGDWGKEGTPPIVAVQNQKGGQAEFEW